MYGWYDSGSSSNSCSSSSSSSSSSISIPLLAFIESLFNMNVNSDLMRSRNDHSHILHKIDSLCFVMT
jgi:hypothetical protein